MDFHYISSILLISPLTVQYCIECLSMMLPYFTLLEPTPSLLNVPNAAILLVLGILALQRVDTSIIYHMVRGQSILKLYVIFNMLDIFERLLTSVGRDTLDSLYWLAVERFCSEPGKRKRKRDAVNLVLHFVISNVYVCILFSTIYGNGWCSGSNSVSGMGSLAASPSFSSSHTLMRGRS